MTQFFRAGVGAVITNEKGEVLAFERANIPGAWQLPQGGIEEGEEPVDAIKREILEETGIKEDDLFLVREHPDLLTYELPMEYRSKKTGRGQTQRWFLFRLIGDEPDIRTMKNNEFVAWEWIRLTELIEKTVYFRQHVYRQIAAAFTLVQ